MWRILSASATELPPNFITIMGKVYGKGGTKGRRRKRKTSHKDTKKERRGMAPRRKDIKKVVAWLAKRHKREEKKNPPRRNTEKEKNEFLPFTSLPPLAL